MLSVHTHTWEGDGVQGPPTLGCNINLHFSEELPGNHPGNAIAHQQKENQRIGGCRCCSLGRHRCCPAGGAE